MMEKCRSINIIPLKPICTQKDLQILNLNISYSSSYKFSIIPKKNNCVMNIKFFDLCIGNNSIKRAKIIGEVFKRIDRNIRINECTKNYWVIHNRNTNFGYVFRNVRIIDIGCPVIYDENNCGISIKLKVDKITEIFHNLFEGSVSIKSSK